LQPKSCIKNILFLYQHSLAAITTLYMMETAKQKNGVLHSSMDFPGKIHVTKKPSTVPKSTTWTTHAPSSTTGFYIRTKGTGSPQKSYLGRYLICVLIVG